MSIRAGFAMALTLGLCALAVPAGASESCSTHPGNTFDGRHYAVVVASGIAWDDARAAAEGMTEDGLHGQLATINSAAEDEYLYCLVKQTEGAREAWVGGSQAEGATEPDVGWQWLNGEPIAGSNATEPYTNWQGDEPNNLGGDERHLAINLSGDFGWNDEGNLGNIGSYVVEFGDRLTSFAASDCAASGDGCPLSNLPDAQIIRFPPAAIIGDGDITATVYRLSVSCGRTTALSLFDGAVVIPAYLCGNDVVITKTESDVEIPRGVVTVENQEDNPFGCDAPIPSDADPTEQDVIGYQTTLPSDMLETGFVSGTNPRFVGSLHEVTSGCVNPSRGSGVRGSWWAAGLRIDPGAGNSRAENAAGNHAFMVALQRHKLKVLRAAALQAKPALRRIDWTALVVLADAVIFLHDRGHYELALAKLRLLRYLNDRVPYKVVPGENYNGEIAYRVLNAEDMYARRIIPFAP
jgi:hypothetical protein